MLYELAKDIMATPAMSAPAESFFSILIDAITKKRNRLFPATTKMLAVVKDMVRKIGPGDEESGVESDDDNVGDDVELNDMISKEIDDVSGDQMEVDIAEATEIN
ncbi:hypothetical protein OXX80_013276 [Metschnikowia pulcherrima]